MQHQRRETIREFTRFPLNVWKTKTVQMISLRKTGGRKKKKNKPEKRKGLVFVFSLFVTLNEGVKAGCWHRPSKFGYLLFGRRYLKMTSAYALFILLGVPVCSHKTRLQLGVMTVSRKSGTFSMLK